MEQIVFAIFAYAFGEMARRLLEPDPETPLIDEKPTTRSTRGSFIPTLIGTRRIGPFIAWVGERYTITETKSSGGKGSGGSTTKQTVYFESGIHALCVGPAYAIRRLWVNGAIAKLGVQGVGITSDSHPSGSTITMVWNQGEDVITSKFQIYWGEDDGLVNDFAREPNRLGVQSKWPFLCHINWKNMRLGGFAVWPTIEYEVEVRPYGTTELITPAWMYGPGRTGFSRKILKAYNSTNVGDAVDFPHISVSGATRSDGLPIHLEYKNGYSAGQNGLVDVKDQSLEATGILETTWNKTDSDPTFTHEYISRTPNQGGSYNDTTYSDLNLNKDLTAWDNNGSTGAVVDSGYDLGWTDGSGNTTWYGNVFTLNSATNDQDDSLTVSMDEGYFNMRDTAYGAVQGFQLYVSGLLPHGDTTSSGSNYIKMGFTNGASGYTHQVKIYLDSTQTVVVDLSESNGAWARFYSYEYKFKTMGESWYHLAVFYKTRTGDNRSEQIDPRTWSISCHNTNGKDATLNVCTLDKTGYSVDLRILGYIYTGTTTIELSKPLQGAFEDQGTAEGIGDYDPLLGGRIFDSNVTDGANPAHVLYQLLFTPFPHGAGLSTENWDMPSLEALAVLTESEGARTHVLAPNGKMAKGIITSVLHDTHSYIAWDIVKGKYVFGSIRDDADTALPNIPLDAVLSPAPEHDSVHEVGIPNQLVFSYASRYLAYRNSTRVAFEDTVASEFNNRIIKKSSITTATDSFCVDRIAERKQLEELVPVNKYKIVANRDAKYLHPGQAFTVTGLPSAGEENTLRVIETQYSPGDKKVTIDAITDVYSLVDTVASASLSPPDPGFEAPGFEQITVLQDVATSIWELPPKLAFGTFSYMPLRIRANQKTGQTPAFSSKDDITYALAATDIPYCTGGALEDATDSTSDDIDTLVVTGLGEDMETFPQTLDDNNWAAGQQLCVIDDEVFFLKSVTSLGNNRYSLNGLKRAKHTSTAAVHDIGSVAFIFPIGSITRIKDPLAEEGQAIYVKPVPLSLTLADITTAKITKTLTGTGQVAYQSSPTDASIRDALTSLGFMKES